MNSSTGKEVRQGVSEERLSIEVTTHCNSACSHCFARAGILKGSSLTIDLVKEIITEGYNTAYCHLHITGGEPLLWGGLFEALDYAFDLGYKTISLNTNGTLLAEDICNRLAAYDGLSISVSLHGPKAHHDSICGKGSYSRTAQCIDKALNAGVDLYIFTTVYKSLLPVLPYFTDEIYRKFPGIRYLALIQLIGVTNDFFDLSKELLDPENFLQLVRTVSLLNLYGLKTSVLNNPLACVASKLLEMPWIPPAYSPHRAGSIIVMANRNIMLSHSARDGFGKYEKGMIVKVLASDEYRKATAPDEVICPVCDYAEICVDNGMIRPSECYKDMHPEELYCKRVLDRAAL